MLAKSFHPLAALLTIRRLKIITKVIKVGVSFWLLFLKVYHSIGSKVNPKLPKEILDSECKVNFDFISCTNLFLLPSLIAYLFPPFHLVSI